MPVPGCTHIRILRTVTGELKLKFLKNLVQDTSVSGDMTETKRITVAKFLRPTN